MCVVQNLINCLQRHFVFNAPLCFLIFTLPIHCRGFLCELIPEEHARPIEKSGGELDCLKLLIKKNKENTSYIFCTQNPLIQLIMFVYFGNVLFPNCLHFCAKCNFINTYTDSNLILFIYLFQMYEARFFNKLVRINYQLQCKKKMRETPIIYNKKT